MKPNNSRHDYHRRMARRRRRNLQQKMPLLFLGILLICIIGCGVFVIGRQFKGRSSQNRTTIAQSVMENSPNGSSGGNDNSGGPSGSNGPGGDDTLTGENGENAFPGQEEQTSSGSQSAIQISGADYVLENAALLAAGYDYDKAIEMLKNSDYAGTDTRIPQAIAEYEGIREGLKPYDLTQITHIFFHTLIMDESKAFDGDADESGYNQVMTTKDEFLKILQLMYEKGYVLVRLHDIAQEVTGDDGSVRMEKGTILLPEGKKAFVMSQDDVCYYEYMENDGFASRMIIGEDGKPTCEMKMDDGTVSVGSYDLVPLLEDFIQEHPDFSYRGARAVIAFTGYQGILGYRTADSYSDSPTYEQDQKDAAAVAQCLRDNGWELASHSWGHRDLGSIEFSKFKADSDKWESQVKSLIGPTDIILFPFGADIGDWHPYTRENDRFNYLRNLGFRYFCNVDSNQYWIQFGKDFIRQGRRNLDGYRMWKDIETGSDTSKRKLDDLFRAEDVFSSNRPTPVTWD